MHIYAESPHSAGNTLLKNFDFHIYISDVFHNSLANSSILQSFNNSM